MGRCHNLRILYISENTTLFHKHEIICYVQFYIFYYYPFIYFIFICLWDIFFLKKKINQFFSPFYSFSSLFPKDPPKHCSSPDSLDSGHPSVRQRNLDDVWPLPCLPGSWNVVGASQNRAKPPAQSRGSFASSSANRPATVRPPLLQLPQQRPTSDQLAPGQDRHQNASETLENSRPVARLACASVVEPASRLDASFP